MDRYSLDNGNVITATLLGDNGARVDYKNWSWHLRYKFSSDVPAAVV